MKNIRTYDDGHYNVQQEMSGSRSLVPSTYEMFVLKFPLCLLINKLVSLDIIKFV